ncbi:HNH endonuclease signature motif containing protein [Flavobacterium sp.]|uniref:HNH endonuclease signature motif containing protein n=1 Tax=Flavobacterium sp. TaxID=239 RepID=UPI0026255561|nr:HNH endonuclease signature motif containing protein [Flavobacterium sp.]MDD3005841.1 HNH endonuclease signature motif containing protein [Flavobacterium sp.]
MAFTEKQIQEVWEKGKVVPGNDPNIYRTDCCDAWIKRNEYGNRNSNYGWEIDHITPKSNDGGDELSNLRPLQWENNMSKSNGRLVCVITAKGIKNEPV